MMLTFKLAYNFSMRFDWLKSEYYFGFIVYCGRLVDGSLTSIPYLCVAADGDGLSSLQNRLRRDAELLRHSDPSAPWRTAFEPAEHLLTLTLVIGYSIAAVTRFP